MKLLTRLLLARGARRGLRKRRRDRKQAAEERIVEPGTPQPRSELVVIGLLLLCALFSVAFVVIYAIDALASRTRCGGLPLGGALLYLSAEFIGGAKQLVVTEQKVEPYPEPHEEE